MEKLDNIAYRAYEALALGFVHVACVVAVIAAAELTINWILGR